MESLVARESFSMIQQTRASSSPKERFDSNGARKAAIALLTAIYKTGRHGTIAEVLIALEVIDSNLSSAETAQLLQLAKEAFEHEVASDPKLKARAGASAQRAITGVLFNLGFRKVEFVDRLPGLDSN